MTALDWSVIAAGVSLLVGVNWYFFGPHGAAATAVATATAPAAGSTSAPPARPAAEASSPLAAAPRATITVHGGYSPSVVRVPAGQAVQLVFDRQETSSCSEEVVFADFGVRRYLPANRQTVVEVTPPAAGTYEFACGMGMLRGKLIAE